MDLIQKDDEARDILGLPKPTLLDFEEITVKNTMLKREMAAVLFSLGIGDNPDTNSYVTAKQPAKRG